MTLNKTSRNVLCILTFTPTALIALAMTSMHWGSSNPTEQSAGIVPAVDEKAVESETPSQSESSATQIAVLPSTVVHVATTPLSAASPISVADEQPVAQGILSPTPADAQFNQSSENANAVNRAKLSAEHRLLREALDELQKLMATRNERGNSDD